MIPPCVDGGGAVGRTGGGTVDAEPLHDRRLLLASFYYSNFSMMVRGGCNLRFLFGDSRLAVWYCLSISGLL